MLQIMCVSCAQTLFTLTNARRRGATTTGQHQSHFFSTHYFFPIICMPKSSNIVTNPNQQAIHLINVIDERERKNNVSKKPRTVDVNCAPAMCFFTNQNRRFAFAKYVI